MLLFSSFLCTHTVWQLLNLIISQIYTVWQLLNLIISQIYLQTHQQQSQMDFKIYLTVKDSEFGEYL